MIPLSAHIVLHAGWPIRLVSLDATNHADMRREQFTLRLPRVAIPSLGA